MIIWHVLHNLYYGESQYRGLIQIWPADLSIYKNRQTERSLAWAYLTNQNASSIFVKLSIVEAIQTVKNIIRFYWPKFIPFILPFTLFAWFIEK